MKSKYLVPHQVFTTDICKIEGIGRFYIGLANHITILEGDALKQYAADYAKKYLPK